MLLSQEMPHKKSETLNKAAAGAFRDIPGQNKHTLTVDNGKEFAGHKALAKILGCPVYFARPNH